MTELPVELVKDTAAACVAELVAGRGRSIRSFLYVFVDTFIGGGLVIDSHLRGGAHRQRRRGRLAAAGPGAGADGAPAAQLLSVASLLNLEALYAEAGLDSARLADARALQPPWRRITACLAARGRRRRSRWRSTAPPACSTSTA